MSNKNVHEPERITIVVSMVRDITSVAILGLILLSIYQFGQPFHRGFTCDDESIRYPYKDSTVPAWLLHIVGAAVNILLIVIYEFTILKKLNKQQQQQQFSTPSAEANSNNDNANQGGFKWRSYMSNVYCHLLILSFGMIISEFFTVVAKFSIGRLRPHFFSMCEPFLYIDNEWKNATIYCRETKDPYIYHTTYQCRGPMADDKERAGRLSFMSGHSSYAAFCATHAIIYLQSAMNVSVLGLVKPSFQSIIAATALYTGLSRVSDYKHHWQDVLAGLIQGTLVAIVLFRYLLPTFKQSYSRYNRTTPRRAPYNREMDSGEELNHVY